MSEVSAASTSSKTSSVQRCYVCGRDAEDPFKDSRLRDDFGSGSGGGSSSNSGFNNNVTISRKCDEFEQGDKLGKFALECPSGYSSCLTQIDGKCSVLVFYSIFLL